MVSSSLDKAAIASIRSRFVADAPHPRIKPSHADLLAGRIAGCHANPLQPATDGRGDLFELMTTRDGESEPLVHAYQVWAEPHSIRAWVLHVGQTDRLCFTSGSFQVALFDSRPESPTAGAMISLLVGADAPVRLTIAPFVAHGVRNLGAERAAFLNFPTAVYDHASPDKSRLPFDTDLIPFRW